MGRPTTSIGTLLSTEGPVPAASMVHCTILDTSERAERDTGGDGYAGMALDVSRKIPLELRHHPHTSADKNLPDPLRFFLFLQPKP